jgi:hypothetical protein
MPSERDRALETAREWFEYEPCNEQNLAELILSVERKARVKALTALKVMRKRVWTSGEGPPLGPEFIELKDGAVPMWWIRKEITRLRADLCAERH